MTPERWMRVKEVLNACLDLPRDSRSAYLDSACEGDPELRSEVESLAASYDAADDVLERPLHPVDDPGALVGRIAGGYRFIREIGEGGMARVYLAERTDGVAPRLAAIKVVKRGMDYEFVQRRFRHERQIMAALEHPNIARLLEGGTTEEGIPYFVMEYIPGQPIDQYCDDRRLGVHQRLVLFRTVCLAVQYAHEQGVVHRDIKPGNILITADGVPKLLDFGIAKVVDPSHWTHSFDLTASVLRLMTPEYASPEQVRGEYVFEPTDVYSLGVLLFELLTGRRPYRVKGKGAGDLALAICEQEPGRPSSVALHREEIGRLPGGTPVVLTPEEVSRRRGTDPQRLRRELSGDLDNIVLMALRKEPRRRYASVREMSEDIRRHMEGRPVTARHDTVSRRTGKFVGRHRRALAAAGGLAAVLALGLAVWRWRAPEAAAIYAPRRVRPLTTLPGNERQPVFSPDGRGVAFVWGGEDGRNSDIYVRSLAGPGLERITSDDAEEASPAWAPDGSRIAFLRTGHDRAGVFLAPLAGGVPSRIAEVHPTRIEAPSRQLDWSPDGEHLAMVDKASPDQPYAIYLLRVSDGSRRRLTQPPPRSIGDNGPSFSPDGRWIGFVRASASGIAEVWVARLEGGGERRLTHDSREVFAQTWTPDGASIVFASNRTGNTGLWQVGARGGTPRLLPGVGNAASEPAFSRDGRHLAYSQFFRDANVWRAGVGGGDPAPPRRLISSPLYDSSAQYSPDGRRIAFRSDRSGSHEIWVCDADGRNALQLTRFNGPLTGTPRWSPDGEWIAFDSRPEGQADIFVAPARGGAPRRVTSDPAEDVVPSWSRDGKWIYFGSNRGGPWQVWKTPAGGGARVQVTRNGGFAAFESIDGRHVYYALSRSQPGLYRVPVEGGAEESVLPELKAGYWGNWALAPDGVYFADREDGPSRFGLHFLRFGGKRSLVTPLEKPLVPGDSAMALSPDGRSLLFTQLDQSGADIMLAETGPRPLP